MSDTVIDQAAAALRRLLEAIERGELTAGALSIAYLEGALHVLEWTPSAPSASSEEDDALLASLRAIADDLK